jgi:hypothetical protein
MGDTEETTRKAAARQELRKHVGRRLRDYYRMLQDETPPAMFELPSESNEAHAHAR